MCKALQLANCSRIGIGLIESKVDFIVLAEIKVEAKSVVILRWLVFLLKACRVGLNIVTSPMPSNTLLLIPQLRKYCYLHSQTMHIGLFG